MEKGTVLTLARCVQWGHSCPGNWSEWYQLDACQKTSRVGVLSPLGGSSFLKRKRIGKQMKETAGELLLMGWTSTITNPSLQVSRRRKLFLFSKHYNNNKSKTKNMGFPGGLVIKNLPANAGDTGSIPGPGRFHMPVCHNHWDRALESVLCNKRSHRNKNPEYGR